MDTIKLKEQMASTVTEVPKEAAILTVRQYSAPDIKQRVTDFLGLAADVLNLPLQDGVWNTNQTQTIIQLPLGVHATIYHASGAMLLISGINTMESLFAKVLEKETLVQLVEKTAAQLNLASLMGQNESLKFERLWQIKAAAADRNNATVSPVLCRIVGAYRHFVRDLPVWGPASVAIRLANEGVLDSLIVQLRETTNEVISVEPVIDPEKAADVAVQQINNLINNHMLTDHAITSLQLRFGYFSLSKRASQPVLAPVYIASYDIDSRSYLKVIPATEKTYISID